MRSIVLDGAEHGGTIKKPSDEPLSKLAHSTHMKRCEIEPIVAAIAPALPALRKVALQTLKALCSSDVHRAREILDAGERETCAALGAPFRL